MTGKSLSERIADLGREMLVEAKAAWLAARDPRVPMLARLLAVGIAAYALSPIDIIPDFIPVLGWLDDLILLPAGLWLVRRLVPRPLWAELRSAAQQSVDQPASRAGMLFVLLVWAGFIYLVYWSVRISPMN